MNATLSKLHMDSSRNFRLTNKSINLIIILKLFEKKMETFIFSSTTKKLRVNEKK